jgi:hypothetical protein
MIKSIIKRWARRTLLFLLIIGSGVGLSIAEHRQDALTWRICFGCLIASFVLGCVLWSDEEEEPVTQPLPVVPSEPVTQSLAAVWPDGDVVERELRRMWREREEKPQQRLRQGDEDDSDEVGV